MLPPELAEEIADNLRQRRDAIAQKPRGLAPIAARTALKAAFGCDIEKKLPRWARPNSGIKSVLNIRRRWQRGHRYRIPDRAAYRARLSQNLASWARLVDPIAAGYTPHQLSVLLVYARDHQDHGYCDRSVAEIACLAGVSIGTVLNTNARAVMLRHINRRERVERTGRNMTNVIHVVEPKWMKWLEFMPKKRGQSATTSTYREGGSKQPTASSTHTHYFRPRWRFSGETRKRHNYG